MGRAIGSVVLGVLALIAYLGALFVVIAYSDTGPFGYVSAAAIGLAAVALGWTARKRLPVRASGRGLATVGIVLVNGIVASVTRPPTLTLSSERLSLSEYRAKANAICSEELAPLDELETVDEDASLATFQQGLKPMAAALESVAERLSEFRPPKSSEPVAYAIVNKFLVCSRSARGSNRGRRRNRSRWRSS